MIIFNFHVVSLYLLFINYKTHAIDIYDNETDFEIASNLTEETDYRDKFHIVEHDWRDFWFDLTEYSRLTTYVSILQGIGSTVDTPQGGSRLLDFQSKLIKYLYKNASLPLMQFTAHLLTLSGCTDCSTVTLHHLVSQKQVIIILYESLQSLNESLHNHMWYIFKKTTKSYFFFVITNETLQEIACDSEEFNQIFIETMGIYAEKVWAFFHILETTYIFPYLCGKQRVVKYDFVDTFQSKNYSQGISIITREQMIVNRKSLLHTSNNLKKYPLIVNMFKRIPTMMTSMPKSFMDTHLSKDIEHIGNIGGIDGLFLGNLVKRLNFQPVIREPTDKLDYGYKLPNGTFIGSIGDIIAKRMDISMNGRYLKTYNSNDIEFTYPIFSDQLCILAPKSHKVPHWQTIFSVYSLAVWSIIGSIILLLGFLWWLMKAKFPKQAGEVIKEETWPEMLLEMFLIAVSSPIKLPVIGRERSLLMWCLILNIIIGGIFQGYLSTAYSTSMYYPDINTLEDLDKSGLRVSSHSGDVFGLNTSRVGDSLNKKTITDQNGSLIKAAKERTIVVSERRTDANIMIQLNFTDANGDPELHIVQECPRSYHLCYIVYKGFPFLSHINRFLQRIISAGLNKKWYNDCQYSILLKSRIQEGTISKDTLTLDDVQTSFFILFCGWVVSFVALFYEIVLKLYCARIKYRKKKKSTKKIKENPKFIEYIE